MRISIALALSLMTALPAAAEDFAFAGSWTIVGAVHAPWEDPDKPIVSDDADRYVGKTVTITLDSMEGPGLMGCGKTAITVDSHPFAGIFEGGLAADPKDPGGRCDAAKARRAALDLGFTREPVPTLYQGCSELGLHLRDANTLLFGLNNRIFTMHKQ
jgi:hypothetical protein